MSEEFYKKHRPTKFSQVIGQQEVVDLLVAMGKKKQIPHAILFSGPSGTGKTTLARILRVKLKCSDTDFFEMNTADFRGIDMVREIRDRRGLGTMGGQSRIWLVDECQKLTSDAQDAFLKLLEDTPSHVYFFLCTTDPQKLKKTIITRCTEFKLASLSTKAIMELIERVVDAEGFVCPDEVAEAIVDSAEGSARKALVLLEQAAMHYGNEDKMLEAVTKADHKRQSIELARILMRPKPEWSDVAAILKDLDEDAEGIRRMLLGYFQSVMLGKGKGKDRAYQVIDALHEPLYNIGKPGLTAACWEVVNGV